MLHTAGVTFSGTGPQQLAATRTVAAWITISCPSGNTGTFRVCGSGQTVNGTVSPTTGGYVVAKGASVTLPWSSAPSFYDLQDIYLCGVTNNDTADLMWGS